jgi:hypothetical protein
MSAFGDVGDLVRRLLDDLDLTEEELADHLGSKSRVIRRWGNEGGNMNAHNQCLVVGLAECVRVHGAASVKTHLRKLKAEGSSWAAHAQPLMVAALRDSLGDRVKLEERLAAKNLDAAVRGSGGREPGELKYAHLSMPSKLEDLSLEDLLALLEPNEIPWDRMAAALAS